MSSNRLERLLELRPYLYHFTARENTGFLQERRSLLCTNLLLGEAGADAAPSRRASKRAARISGADVIIRDQAPLYEANIELQGGWSFNDLLHSLDSRVFFWPGSETGPIDYGRRHFQRYESETPLVLRVPFRALLRENPAQVPQLCKFNSGSPRYVNGRPSPRGPETFLPPDAYPFPFGTVVEITFLETVRLPNETERSDHYEGPWARFFT